MMKLVANVACSLKVAKVYREHTDKVNAIDFEPHGRHMISSGADDQIVIYDVVEQSREHRVLRSKKYGIDLVRFTHSPNAIIHSATKATNNIHYLSIYDNKYLRHYAGHTGKITGLCMSPLDDMFLSVAMDRTMRLWDLRTPRSVGLMPLPAGRTVAAFDPLGIVFAVGVNSEHLKLYDLRSYTKGPFLSAVLPKEKECDWTGLKFSLNGKMVLVSSNGSTIRLLDSFYGRPLQSFQGHQNNKGIPIEASFSPESTFIFAGSTDGLVHCWSIETGYKVCTLNGGHPGPTQCVQFNPRFVMLASACTNVAFWVPAVEEL